MGSLIFLLVFLIICIIGLVFSIRAQIKVSKAKKARKREIAALKAQGMLFQLNGKHTYGLPIAEGLPCTIRAYNDHFDFFSGTTHISLADNKITDVCVKSETDIQHGYVSSIGGAVGGAVLFGPLGAMIGGRAKQKTSTLIYNYLIITYKDDNGNLSYLGFDVTDCVIEANKSVEEYNKTHVKTVTNIAL